MKICTKCKRTLPTTEFYNNKATSSKLDNFCKTCRKTRTINERGQYASPSRFIEPALNIISQGNLMCACCGNKNSKWLQIDHIVPLKRKRRGGFNERAKLTREIVQHKISPKDYQLLCANCNFAKNTLDKCPIDHSLD